MLVTLTQVQWDSLRVVILNNLSETINTLNRVKYNWWKDNVLGYVPYRIDRISDKTFKVYEHSICKICNYNNGHHSMCPENITNSDVYSYRVSQ